MHNRYRAILFALDGEYVTDYDSPSIDEVWEKVDNRGSRWSFYPLVFVIPCGGPLWNRHIVGTADGLESYKGLQVSTIVHTLMDAFPMYLSLQS